MKTIDHITTYPSCLPNARIYRRDVENIIKLAKANCHLSLYLYLASRCAYKDTTVKMGSTYVPILKGECVIALKNFKKQMYLTFKQAAPMLQNLISHGHVSMRMHDSNHIIFTVHGLISPNVKKETKGIPSKSGFFMVNKTVSKLIRLNKKASMADVYADMLINGVHNDIHITGSNLGMLVCFNKNKRLANVGKGYLSIRYNTSPATICRIINRLSEQGYLTAIRLPGCAGSVFYVTNSMLKTECIPENAVLELYGYGIKREIKIRKHRIQTHIPPVETVVCDVKKAICFFNCGKIPQQISESISDTVSYFSDADEKCVSFLKHRVSKSRCKKISGVCLEAFKNAGFRAYGTKGRPLMYVLFKGINIDNYYLLRAYTKYSYKEILIHKSCIPHIEF